MTAPARHASPASRRAKASLHPLRIRAPRAVALLALLGVVTFGPASLAQDPPSRPFQEKGSEANVSTGVVTPQRITDEFEASAKKTQNTPPLERTTSLYIFYAEDSAELATLAGYSVLLLTVVSQKSEELPLKRVYIRTVDGHVYLQKISSWRVNVDPRLLTYRKHGPYREDGLYLFPTGAVFRIGQLQVDFAANRMGLPMLDLPIERLPERVRGFENPDPRPGALPEPGAFQAFLRKKMSGFPVLEVLPQAAARSPAPGSPPQVEPRKPGSLKELFKQ